jgi:hypothetical protein
VLAVYIICSGPNFEAITHRIQVTLLKIIAGGAHVVLLTEARRQGKVIQEIYRYTQQLASGVS